MVERAAVMRTPSRVLAAVLGLDLIVELVSLSQLNNLTYSNIDNHNDLTYSPNIDFLNALLRRNFTTLLNDMAY